MIENWTSWAWGYGMGGFVMGAAWYISGAKKRNARRAFGRGVDGAEGFSGAFRGDLDQAIRLSVEDEAGLGAADVEDLRRGHYPETSIAFARVIRTRAEARTKERAELSSSECWAEADEVVEFSRAIGAVGLEEQAARFGLHRHEDEPDEELAARLVLRIRRKRLGLYDAPTARR